MESDTSLTEKVRSIITATFGDAKIHDLGIDANGYGRVTGVIVSPGFEGQTHLWRQDRLWDALKEGLSPDELRRVSLLMTVSPSEYEAILAD